MSINIYRSCMKDRYAGGQSHRHLPTGWQTECLTSTDDSVTITIVRQVNKCHHILIYDSYQLLLCIKWGRHHYHHDTTIFIMHPNPPFKFACSLLLINFTLQLVRNDTNPKELSISNAMSCWLWVLVQMPVSSWSPSWSQPSIRRTHLHLTHTHVGPIIHANVLNIVWLTVSLQISTFTTMTCPKVEGLKKTSCY